MRRPYPVRRVIVFHEGVLRRKHHKTCLQVCRKWMAGFWNWGTFSNENSFVIWSHTGLRRLAIVLYIQYRNKIRTACPSGMLTHKHLHGKACLELVNEEFLNLIVVCAPAESRTGQVPGNCNIFPDVSWKLKKHQRALTDHGGKPSVHAGAVAYCSRSIVRMNTGMERPAHASKAGCHPLKNWKEGESS